MLCLFNPSPKRLNVSLSRGQKVVYLPLLLLNVDPTSFSFLKRYHLTALRRYMLHFQSSHHETLPMCRESASDYPLPITNQKKFVADNSADSAVVIEAEAVLIARPSVSLSSTGIPGSGSAGSSFSIRCCAVVGLLGIFCSDIIFLPKAFL